MRAGARTLAALCALAVALATWLLWPDSAERSAASDGDVVATSPPSAPSEPEPSTAALDDVDSSARESVDQPGDPDRRAITIRGRVVDSADEPIEFYGLRVVRRDRNNWVVDVTTHAPELHARGEFELANLESARWEVLPFADGMTLAVNPGQIARNFEPRRTWVLRGVAYLDGVVLDPDGTPVEGARVAVAERTSFRPEEEFVSHRHGAPDPIHAAVESDPEPPPFVDRDHLKLFTNAAGAFRSEAHAGTLVLVASAPDWLASEPEVIDMAMKERRRVELRLRRGATLRVRCFDEVGTPLAGWRLELRETGQPVTLDAEGRTELNGLEPGRELFSLREPRTDARRFVGEARVDGSEREFEFRAIRPRPVLVRGRLQSQQRKHPILAFELRPEIGELAPWLDKPFCEVDSLTGSFEIEVPVPGGYSVRDTPLDNYWSVEREIEIPAQDLFELVLEL